MAGTAPWYPAFLEFYNGRSLCKFDLSTIGYDGLRQRIDLMSFDRKLVELITVG